MRQHLIQLLEELIDRTESLGMATSDSDREKNSKFILTLRFLMTEEISEEDIISSFQLILLYSATFPEIPNLELAEGSIYTSIIVKYLNKKDNREFKMELLPGVTEKIVDYGLMSYFNIRATPAIMNEDWLPTPAQYHQYTLAGTKDKSISWTRVQGITVIRNKYDCILMRGDTREPDEIIRARGFIPAVPDSDYADRGNELKLPELQRHFPLRISFTSLLNIGKRYMKNAAFRRSTQFSYIYFVNVKDMEVVDINRNIMEGRIGKNRSKSELKSFSNTWVDEKVVLGSSIPVEKIVQIYKYEIVHQDETSTDKATREGFVLRGIYLPKVDGSGFDYNPVEYIPQHFFYNSVVMVSFNAHSQQVKPYSLGTVSPMYRQGAESPESMIIQRAQLQRHHQSLREQEFPLININYSLEIDSLDSWRQTITKLHVVLSTLQQPAKIYLHSFGVCTDSSFFSFHGPKKNVFPISPQDMAYIFSRAIPIKHGITFHLLSSFGKLVATPFMEELIKVGFTNCFIVSYISDFEVQTSSVDSLSDIIRIYDFSTKDRKDYRKKLMHRSNNPKVADNKIITYWSCGAIRQKGYQEWLKEHVQCYTKNQRKNLWIYNNIAILNELSSWLEEQMMKLSSDKLNRQSKVRDVLYCLIAIASSFHVKLLSMNYDEQDLLNLIIGLFKSIDLFILLLAPTIPSEVDIFRIFKEEYGTFRSSLLPIVPIEFDSLGYDMKELRLPKATVNHHRVQDLEKISFLTKKLLETRTLDFSAVIYQR